jgi:predicted transcriptional regulator
VSAGENAPERRKSTPEVATELANSGMSQRKVAKALGVDEGTVRTDQRKNTAVQKNSALRQNGAKRRRDGAIVAGASRGSAPTDQSLRRYTFLTSEVSNAGDASTRAISAVDRRRRRWLD